MDDSLTDLPVATRYQLLADKWMLGGKAYSVEFGFEYRKGKTFEDVKKARDKALKYGMNKIEYELSMFALFLKDVFKVKRGTSK